MYEKFKQLKMIYNRVDGNRILKEYSRTGILISVILEILLLGLDKKALEIVRLFADYKIEKKLKKRYIYVKRECFKNFSDTMQHKKANVIWFCWFQGLEMAPQIVKCCYHSIMKNLPHKTIQVITYQNMFEFIDFPDYIIDKWKKGYISNTHLSDLLRLELLIKYGGTWIDATVLCTGGNIPDFTLNSDLFLFQELKPGRDGHSLTFSSWFITASTNQKLLIITRDCLYEYWKKKNYLASYYLLHMFFDIACQWLPEEKKKIPDFSNSLPHMLLLRQFELYDEAVYKEITRLTPWHKLTYKVDEKKCVFENTYYSYIIKKYSYHE